jgi:predicted Zn-dependent peptidase
MIGAALSLQTLSTPVFAQIDLSQKPKPGPVRTFEFPKYTEAKLKNGLKVFIVEDAEQPTVSLRLQTRPGDNADQKPGTASMVAELMRKGAGERNALEIAETLNGVGSDISLSSSGPTMTASMSSLVKHLPTMLEVLSDIIIRPTFPEEEFEKLIPQFVAGVRSQKAQANIRSSDGPMQQLARRVIYGKDHVFARFATEESIQDITIEDVRDFHAMYVKPGSASLVVVGDVKKATLMPLLEKTLGQWDAGTSPEINISGSKPMKEGVYFVERPASTQSAVILTANGVPRSHPDYDIYDMISNVLGFGFNSRLYNTLRETYSYTYSPGAVLTGAKEANRFYCGANVRNSVTDSTIIVMKDEVRKLREEVMAEEELTATKRKVVGSYLMSLENSSIIGFYLQASELYGIPMDYYKNTPQRLMAITPQQIQATANKYLTPEKLSVVLIGSPGEKPNLEKFGEVYSFDADLKPIEAIEKISMTSGELMTKHIEALGGQGAIDGITSLEVKTDISIPVGGGRTVKGVATTKMKEGKMYSVMESPVANSKEWTDGTRAWGEKRGAPTEELKENEMESAILKAQPFLLPGAKKLGYNISILGKKEGKIIVILRSPLGVEQTVMLDPETMLIHKVESLQVSAQGNTSISTLYGDYDEIKGAQMPRYMKRVIGGQLEIKMKHKYKANKKIKDRIFVPRGW